MSEKKFPITLSLVKDLIAKQFPAWAHLPIAPVEVGGWDNVTFRLGKKMSIRLPSAARYAAQVPLEQQWLSLLAPCLSYSISQPLALGRPSPEYPWHWSIYTWIEGKSANLINPESALLNTLALQLAQFLRELQAVNTAGGPVPGKHNFYRGASPRVYDAETRLALERLYNIIDPHAAMAVWEKALSSQWDKDPVWIHGDLSAGNILIKDGKLQAVIDFGGMGIGDPACDLVIAWTFLDKESRAIFRAGLDLDADTWSRARGWALWKALITLEVLEDKTSAEALQQQRIISTLISEHQLLF